MPHKPHIWRKLTKKRLLRLYVKEEKQISVIAEITGCSTFMIFTAMKKHKIKRQLPRANPGEYKRWALPSARVCGVGEGIANRVDRLKVLGNGQTPCSTFLIGEIIKEIDGS